MKKILILAAAAMICSTAGAQVLSTFKFDKKALLSAITKSDEAIANPKRNTRGQVWLDRGEAMNKAVNYIRTSLYRGQADKEMLTVLGKNEPTTVKMNDQDFQKYDYPYADIYLFNGVVQFWVIKDVVFEGAEAKAVEAYKKAAELDPKLKEKASAGIASIGESLGLAADAQRYLGNNLGAAELYMASFNVKKEPLVGKIDSVSVFNAGNIYLFDEQYDKAVPVFEAAIANNVWEEGKTPYYLAYALMQQKKYPETKKVLDQGLAKFPGNKELMEMLVSYYTATGGDFTEIKSQMEATLSKDPENQLAWEGLGQIYLNDSDFDKSIEFFTKYVAKFPDSPRSNYYLGDTWFSKADALRTEAEGGTTMSKTARDAKMAEAMEAYRQAWKYLKTSYDQNPAEDAALERLTFVTYRLSDEDPAMLKLYEEELKAKYEAMRERLNNK